MVVRTSHYNASNAHVRLSCLKTLHSWGSLRSFVIYKDFHARPIIARRVSTGEAASL
jgi:hypothetical protein